MIEQQKKKWAQIRQLGKKRYIVKFGILYWGLTTAILWSILMHFIQPLSPWYVRPIIALIVFPLGGILFGVLTWRGNEKRYRKKVNNTD